MEKPFTIVIEEFREKIYKLIKESNFPAYVLINEFNDIIYKLREQDLQIVNQYKEKQEEKQQSEATNDVYIIKKESDK